MKNVKFIIVNLTLITSINCSGQNRLLVDSASFPYQKSTFSIGLYPDSLVVLPKDLGNSLRLPKKPNLSLFLINSTTRNYHNDRWKNAYNPSNSYLTKNKVTGEWVNLSPTDYQINDAKSLLIAGIILGILHR